MSGSKSEAAYKTISEVANNVQVQPHVLRFWESKFEQIQPLNALADGDFIGQKMWH